MESMKPYSNSKHFRKPKIIHRNHHSRSFFASFTIKPSDIPSIIKSILWRWYHWYQRKEAQSPGFGWLRSHRYRHCTILRQHILISQISECSILRQVNILKLLFVLEFASFQWCIQSDSWISPLNLHCDWIVQCDCFKATFHRFDISFMILKHFSSIWCAWYESKLKFGDEWWMVNNEKY
jgi:hypothetical protein